MNKNLKEYLREDETVLWQGEPAAFPLMENGSKFRILRTWLITIVLIGGILAAYMTQNPSWSMEFVIGLSIMGLAIIASPLLEQASIKKQKYFITDQRAILATNAKTFFSMELSDIDEYKVVSDIANQECLVLGSKLFEEMHKQMRWRTCHPMTDMQDTKHKDRALALVFYGISNAGSAVDVLERHDDMRAA